MRRPGGRGRLFPVPGAEQRLGQPPLAASHRVDVAVGERVGRRPASAPGRSDPGAGSTPPQPWHAGPGRARHAPGGSRGPARRRRGPAPGARVRPRWRRPGPRCRPRRGPVRRGRPRPRARSWPPRHPPAPGRRSRPRRRRPGRAGWPTSPPPGHPPRRPAPPPRRRRSGQGPDRRRQARQAAAATAEAAGRARATSTPSPCATTSATARVVKLRNGRDQPLALVPVTGPVAGLELPAAQEDPHPRPTKTGPLGQLGAFVEGGARGRQVAELARHLGEAVQGPQLDLRTAVGGRQRPSRREPRTGARRVVVLLDHAEGDQGRRLPRRRCRRRGRPPGPGRTSGAPPPAAWR